MFKLNDKVELKNNFILAPMTTWSGNTDLTVSDEEAEYYHERSKEVGMVVTGCTFFEKNGQGFDNEFFAGNDEFIPSLKKLADAIKTGGAKAVLQIFHAGRMGNASENELVSASSIKGNYNIFGPIENMPDPRTLTHEEILEFINGFYETVKRAIKAGFDGVEIHGANSYLIQQFFSPNSNRRDDMWGGSVEKRMRLPLEIIKATNKAKSEFANEDFIVGYRFSPEEREVPGISLDETLKFVDKLSDENIDYLSVSLSSYNVKSLSDENVVVGEKLIEKINGRMPLIASGAIATKQNVEEAEKMGYKMLAVGHALVTDAKWLSKTMNGEVVESAVDKENFRKQLIPTNMAQFLINSNGWFKVK